MARSKYKAGYQDMLERFKQAQEHIELQTSMLFDFATGKARYLFRCPGMYSDEYTVVYQLTGGVLSVSNSSIVHTWDDLGEMLKFYRDSLSDLPHNLRMQVLLEAEICKVKAAA